MARSVEEWVGKTDDEAIPPRVRRRVFDRAGGVCALTGLAISPGDQWDCDHRLALAAGGEHRESNLQPALRYAHRLKTAEDSAKKAKIASVRNRHLGISGKKALIPGSKGTRWKKRVDGSVIRRGD